MRTRYALALVLLLAATPAAAQSAAADSLRALGVPEECIREMPAGWVRESAREYRISRDSAALELLAAFRRGGNATDEDLRNGFCGKVVPGMYRTAAILAWGRGRRTSSTTAEGRVDLFVYPSGRSFLTIDDRVSVVNESSR